MNNPTITQAFEALIAALTAAKGEDKSPTARYIAIIITVVEQAQALWLTKVVGVLEVEPKVNWNK